MEVEHFDVAAAESSSSGDDEESAAQDLARGRSLPFGRARSLVFQYMLRGCIMYYSY